MNINKTILSDGRQCITISGDEREITIISPYKKEDLNPSDFREFDHSAKGEGCSIYRPMRMKDGTTKNLLIRGSMSLMVELGWIAQSELGPFSDLIFDNHTRTGWFEPGLKIRFAPVEDITIFSSARVVQLDYKADESWYDIYLNNGESFKGQPHASLEKLVEMGLVEVKNPTGFKSLNKALEKISKAREEYTTLVESLGGVIQGSEEYNWYEIPGIPGRWNT